MTAKEKILPAPESPPSSPDEGARQSPEVQARPGADDQAESGPGSANRFALYWFGIPLLLILAAVFARLQCSPSG